MKCFLLIVILAVTLNPQLFARLGNTEAQIAELYGTPVDSGLPDKNGITTNRYQKGDYIVLVQFLRDLSIAESYTRVDKQEFSEKELSTLLQGSYTGGEWIKDQDKLAWERVDHHAKAWCQTLGGRPTLLIQAK
jgi:hypothetical protein